MILVLGGVQTYGQKLPVKWGKVTSEEWDLNQVSYDPEAAAIILCDFGVAQFAGSKLKVTYHRRLKILKPEALEEADIEIPYYIKDRTQSVSSLKAQTIKLVNGKQEVHAISNREVFHEKVSEEWHAAKFVFPDVSIGSILEYSYTLTSENVVFLRSWDFQNNYPTVHSEFRAAIPTYLDYTVIFQGSRLREKYKGNPKSQWFLRNIPSIKPEPYMTTIEDFRETLRFQLSGYYKAASGPAGGSDYQTLMTTWEALGEELNTNAHFGLQIKKKGLSKNILETLSLEGKSSKVKLEIIYDYVSQNYTWDRDYDTFADRDLKEVYATKEGSSAEINLLLIMLLSNAGLEVNPVLISTRNHGMVSKNIPLLSQFNTVIARAEIDGVAFLLDATDPLRPSNLLAEDDLNQFGLLVLKKAEPKWIDIAPPKQNVRNVIMTIDLTDLSNPKASFRSSFDGYFALSHRRKIKKGVEKLVPMAQEAKALKFDYSNLEILDKPLGIDSEEFDLEIVDNGDLIYVQPVLVNYYPENPFRSPTRTYPIDFGSSFKEIYAITVLIPDGYKVEEIPEATALKLPRGYGYFQYQTEVNENKVQMMIRMGISKPTIGYGLYDGLVQFYDLMISKLNAQLVLRKD